MFDDYDPPIDARIPSGRLGNRLFRTQSQARRAAIAMMNHLNRTVGLGHTYVHHRARLPGHQSHYHVVNPHGRRISGHFFYGSSPFWTHHRRREMEAAGAAQPGRPAAWYGTGLERAFLQGWRRDLGSEYQVYLKDGFPLWLQRIFPTRSKPDLVAINRRQQHILVGDATRLPRPEHIRKTFRYAQQLAQNLPPEFQNYRVFAQERYWGVEPMTMQLLGLRGNTSQRVEVQRRSR